MEESEYQRRQRMEAARILRSVMPDLSQVMRDITSSQVDTVSIGTLYGDHYRELLGSFSRNVSVIASMPKIDVSSLLPKIDVPDLKLDYSSLFPDFSKVHENLWESVRPSVEAIQILQRDQFADIIKNARAMVRAAMPPNWRDDNITIPANLEVMLLDEGLALAWVPQAAVVQRLFSASSAQERRRILGARWTTVTKACITELEGIEQPKLGEHTKFALKAAKTLLAGHAEPAQALSANLLDTILRQSFDAKDLKAVTGQKTRMKIDDYPLRVAIVLGGIWGSFGEFWASKGTPIPRNFSRHGSAHAVSQRQYSRINSLLALMHVVSLLKLLETDLSS
jgi:hypothetical protein